MAKYRKKPVEIEAFKFYVDPMPDWFMDKVSSNKVILRDCDYNKNSIDEAHCEIRTLEGTMIASGGDYIIKGIRGEIYPCKPDIFNETYEKVEGIGEKYFEKVIQMSKEQLEKAKKILNHIKGYGVYDGNDDIEIFEWLIAQAERVQELEQDVREWEIVNEQWEQINTQIAEQNKRYREAIERAIDKLTWNSVESEEILLKALEGEN